MNDFFGRGTPTFVLGTQGGPESAHLIETQVSLLRGMIMPGTPVMNDTAIDLERGLEAWPTLPVVYGGANANALVAGLEAELPLRADAHRIEIGSEVFEGEGMRLVTVVPAGDRHPEFVLFAGTGPAGITEINAGLPLDSQILVADAFGPLVKGAWRHGPRGWTAELGSHARRIEYRTTERQLESAAGSSSARVTFHFPAMVPASPGDEPFVDASMRGLQTVVRRLEIEAPVPVSVYVYPDRRSKLELTTNDGDGHAVPSSRTVHVLAIDALAAESLMAHEGTHVLGTYALGPAASALMGEGLAVWVSGSYGGRPLEAWRGEVDFEPIDVLLGPRWLALPETQKYPLAAFVLAAAIEEVGLAAVAEHLLAATPESWAERCAAAGTDPATIEHRVTVSLAP